MTEPIVTRRFRPDILSQSDPKDVADTYDFFVKLRAFDRAGAVEGSGVENYLAILKQQGDLEREANLTRFYDAALR